MDGTQKKPLVRSPLMTLAYQAEGLCDALKILAATKLNPGATTHAFLKKLEEQARQDFTGPVIKGWPATDGNDSLADLIVRAEILRKSAVLFLTPEELTDYQKATAFDLAALNRERVQQ